MDYNSLRTQIIAYTQRNEPVFVSAVPALIEQAMSRIYSEAKTIGFQKTLEAQMIINQPVIDKPVDFKAPVSLYYTNTDSQSVFLLPRSYEFCTLYWPDVNLIDEPMFYSTDLDVPQNNAGNSRIYIAPTPDMAYPYKLTYLSFPPVFNAGNSQNFLTDRYPNLLLYACLVEAIPFLKSDERVPMFESLYSKALDAVNKDTRERYTDRGTRRDKD